MSLGLFGVYACATVSESRAWISEQDEKMQDWARSAR